MREHQIDQSFKSKSTFDTNRKNVSFLAPKTSVLAPFRVSALIAFLFPAVLAINGCSDQTQTRVSEVAGRNAFPIDQNYSGPSLLPLRIETTPVDEDLYRFFIIAFGASPGGIYIEQLREAFSAGMSVKQIVDVFTTKVQFLSRYPRTLPPSISPTFETSSRRPAKIRLASIIKGCSKYLKSEFKIVGNPKMKLLHFLNLSI